MHTPNVAKSVHRLKGLLGALGSFEGSAISQMISECLLGVISQKLIPSELTKEGLLMAYELLYLTKRAREYISENKPSHLMNDVIEKESHDRNSGAQTFEQHLYSLWRERKISQTEALKNAESKENLLRLMELNHFDSDSESLVNMDWSSYFKVG
jgi:Tfp pilus assembly pilus retraction ATPase PilT